MILGLPSWHVFFSLLWTRVWSIFLSFSSVFSSLWLSYSEGEAFLGLDSNFCLFVCWGRFFESVTFYYYSTLRLLFLSAYAYCCSFNSGLLLLFGFSEPFSFSFFIVLLIVHWCSAYFSTHSIVRCLFEQHRVLINHLDTLVVMNDSCFVRFVDDTTYIYIVLL